jgi:Flp pilus assembly protein TadG
MVEFALVLPLLALMLFGIIQYGFIFNAYMTLRHSAHQVARTLSLPSADMSVANAQTIACSNIAPMLQCANLATPQVTNITVGGVGAVRVNLSYDLPLIIRFVVPNANENGVLTIQAAATYRKEGQ